MAGIDFEGVAKIIKGVAKLVKGVADRGGLATPVGHPCHPCHPSESSYSGLGPKFGLHRYC